MGRGSEGWGGTCRRGLEGLEARAGSAFFWMKLCLCLCHSGTQHQKVLGGWNKRTQLVGGVAFGCLSRQSLALGSGKSHFWEAVILDNGNDLDRRGLKITQAWHKCVQQYK